MKKIALILSLVASTGWAQVSNVTINANGTILNTQTVKFGAAKLQVNGVEVFGTPLQTGNSGKFLTTNGTALSWATVAAGTVSSVAVSGANGIGVAGSPITSAGTISLSLGAITPTSVAASGAVSGSNLSGTNTGDQYGGVTASGAIQYLRRNAGNTAYEFGALPATLPETDPLSLHTANDLSDLNDPAQARINLGVAIGTNVQAFGADLTALEALSGTNTIYYRSAASTWTAVTIGGNMTFTGGTLDSVATGNPFSDSTAIVKGSADATKLLRLEVDGFTTGTTRVLTPPNFDGTIATLAGTEAFSNKTSLAIGTGSATDPLHVVGAGRFAVDASNYFRIAMGSGNVAFTVISGISGGAEYVFNGLVGLQIPTQTYESGNWANSDLAATQGGVQQALDLTSAATGQGVKATSDDTVASASTINLTSVGPQIDVTGTTTITAITLPDEEVRVVRFTGALTLTDGASLLLPGGANILTANGDYAHVVGHAAGVVEVTRFQKASLAPQSTVADFDGGAIYNLDRFGIRTSHADGFQLLIQRTGTTYVNDRTLSIGMLDGDRTLTIGGNVQFGAAFSTVGGVGFNGAFTTEFVVTANSVATLPAGTHDLAPLDSPTFTGAPTLPTGSIATTQTAADSSTKIATTAFVTKTAPIIVVVKSVAVLTTGTPADIATISIPAGITRWRLAGGNTVGTAGGTILAETAAGTLAGASFTAFDAAGGTGLTLTAAVAGPTAAGVGGGWQMVSAATISTSTTIHIRQTANSANAGTVSFYLLIQPLL